MNSVSSYLVLVQLGPLPLRYIFEAINTTIEPKDDASTGSRRDIHTHGRWALYVPLLKHNDSNFIQENCIHYQSLKPLDRILLFNTVVAEWNAPLCSRLPETGGLPK